MTKGGGGRKQRAPEVPNHTRSLDAKVPAENVVLTHFMADLDQWVAASEASDGRVFFGFAATEPLARRAAGLRTLAHLEERASGEVGDIDEAGVEAARTELLAALSALVMDIEGANLPFPESQPRDIVLIEIRSSRELVEAQASASQLVRWTVPPLRFLASSFASGIIGKGAEKALEILGKLLGG